MSTRFELKPLSGRTGAEVFSVDLAGDLPAETVAKLRRALLEHHVLVFRGQQLSPEEQLRFGRRFGELERHPFVAGNADHPEMIDIITEPEDTANFGGGWHTDLTFREAPDLGSILYAVQLPPAGGDTLFANQQAAYEALSETMKGILDGLVAVHSAAEQYGPRGYSTRSRAVATTDTDLAAQGVEHPVVRTHPESGRKALYVNRAFTARIKDMRRDESAALLEFLFRHAVKEPFTCRVRWEPGTLTMWDNRSVQHYALHDYAGHRRHMRRITIRGDRPV
ncbi:MAG: TauD/TfdA family dioxygenase [Myxococcales bacterium]|nr:TauD/TfdA family dioxygenase [Myxococcales bacterium]